MGVSKIAERCICVTAPACLVYSNNFVNGGYIYNKLVDMNISKIGLIRMVLRESTIDDVLNGSWEDAANREMDVEFYRDKTELFWKELEQLISVLRNMPPEDQEEWADYYKFEDEIKYRVYEWLERMDVSWVRQHVPDEFVYKYIIEWKLDSGNADEMYELANTVIPYVLKRYVGKTEV